METEHGWPKGYGWPEYIEGQLALAKATLAERILCDEIATLNDLDEKARALSAWRRIGAEHMGRTGQTLLTIESDLRATFGELAQSARRELHLPIVVGRAVAAP